MISRHFEIAVLELMVAWKINMYFGSRYMQVYIHEIRWNIHIKLW